MYGRYTCVDHNRRRCDRDTFHMMLEVDPREDGSLYHERLWICVSLSGAGEAWRHGRGGQTLILCVGVARSSGA